MKVEVGDWVKIRGMRRIYEVQSTIPEPDKGPAHFITINDSNVLRRVSTVEAVAPKFWIKKAEP